MNCCAISSFCGGLWRAVFCVCAFSSFFASFLSPFPYSISFSGYCFYPLQIGRITLLQLYGGDLRNFIAMEFSDAAPYSLEEGLPTLDHDERFPLVPDLSLPPVDGADLRYDVCAGGQSLLHQGPAYRSCLLVRGSGYKNDYESLRHPLPHARSQSP